MVCCRYGVSFTTTTIREAFLPTQSIFYFFITDLKYLMCKDQSTSIELMLKKRLMLPWMWIGWHVPLIASSILRMEQMKVYHLRLPYCQASSRKTSEPSSFMDWQTMFLLQKGSYSFIFFFSCGLIFFVLIYPLRTRIVIQKYVLILRI